MSDVVRPAPATVPDDSMSIRRAQVQNARPLLWVLLATTLGSHGLLLWVNRHSIAVGSYDFVAFYSAGQIVQQGLGKQLYDPAVQHRFQRQFPPRSERPLLYYHPPFEALLYAVFAVFSYPTAFLLWMAFSLVALCAVPFLLFPRLQNLEDTLGKPLVFLLLLSFYPVTVTLWQGQDSILLLLLYCGAFAEMRRGKQWRAGLLCALGLFRFQLMIPLFLVFLFGRTGKVLWGFLAGSAGMALLSVWIAGWQGLLGYARLLWTINETSRQNPAGRDFYYIHPEAMPNLRGLLDTQLAGRMPEAMILFLIVGGSLFLLGWSVKRGIGKHSLERTGQDLPFALHTTVTLLVTYHMHLHDLTLLLLPLLIISNHLLQAPAGSRPVRLGLLLLVVGFFATPVYIIPFYFEQANLLALLLLAFAFLIGREMARNQRGTIASL